CFDQVIVDFFLIDKLLKTKAVVAFDDANWLSVRKALRYIIMNRHYSVVGSLAAPWSRKDKLARILRPITRYLPFKPEITNPDGALGLLPGSRCIVLRKEAADNRDSAGTDHLAF